MNYKDTEKNFQDFSNLFNLMQYKEQKSKVNPDSVKTSLHK